MSKPPLPWLEDAIRSTGKFQCNSRNTMNVSNSDLKGRVDLVTEVDHESEERLVEAIRDNRPQDGVLAEENFRHEGENDRCWIIDPLDGTTNYVHDHPFYAISVGLQAGDRIDFGMTYFPESDDLFWAEHSEGAYKNGDRIHVSDTDVSMDSFLATGFADLRSEDTDLRYNLEVFPDLLQKVQGIRRGGSAVHDLCLTACGVFDGFWEFNLQPWDVAAGALIIEEAGGTVTDMSGGEDWLNGQNIVASNGHIQDRILDWIRPHLPDDFPASLRGA